MGKSQVTVFIVLGMLIIAVASLLIYIESISQEDVEVQVKEKYVLKSSLQPVKMYVESCLEQSAEKPVQIIGNNGGKFSPERFTYFDKENFRYLCRQKGGDECVNSVLKRRDMEERLSERIEKNAKECINLDIFRKQGYNIKEGALDADIKIGLEKMEIKADYPLLFRKNNSELKIKEFTTRVNEPLGELYLLATDIINREISENRFDYVDFMINNGMNVQIRKHKPYPDTVYSLKKDNYTFNFALEGEDTVSNVGYNSFTSSDSNYGCCYVDYDNNCYENVPRTLCEEKGGLYDPNSACKCPVVEPSGETDCQGEVCDDCENVYEPETGKSNGIRQHGESWCGYGGITGNGTDPVGSRHYLHYCIDGREYVQGCRDYREELCTQGEREFNGKNLTRAVCRPNRWESCSDCETKECCVNPGPGDCAWKEVTKECVPEVPPGFRFWEGNGASVCAAASKDKTCEGFGCGSDWVTNVAETCFSYGDCGNYRNVNGQITKEGFFDTDIRAGVDEDIYNTGKDVKPLELDTNAFGEANLLNTEGGKVGSFASIMSSAYSFMDSLSNMKLSGVQEGEAGDVSVKNAGICGIWKAPENGECGKCSEMPGRCTEYRCKSLGKSCIYEEKKGVGYCHEPVEEELSPPKINFNDSLMEGVTVEETDIMFNGKTINGYRIKEELNPFDMLKFGINTGQETICRIRYLPENSVLSMEGHYVGEGFEKQHEISLTVPPRPDFPRKLLDFMNSSNASEFLVQLRENVISAPENSSLRKVFSVILGEDAFEGGTEFAKLFTSGLETYREASNLLLNKIEGGGYYLFFDCENRAGIHNKEEFFLEVDINNGTADSSSPGVKGIEPANNSKIASDKKQIQAQFYMDEPSTCRFSLEPKAYNAMNNTMECAKSRYDISEKFSGSYLCRGTIPAENQSVKVYVSCKDNPVRIEETGFKLRRVNVSGTALNVNSETNKESFTYGADNLTINYYMSKRQECSLTYTGGIKEEGSCSVANNMELGQYKCGFDINTTNKTNLSVNILCSEDLDVERKEASFVYELQRSQGLKIIDYGPKGDIETNNPLLYVETSDSKGVKCGFYKEMNLGIVMMEKMAENKYSTILENVSEGSQEYHVTCRDDYGNSIDKEIEFYVKD